MRSGCCARMLFFRLGAEKIESRGKGRPPGSHTGPPRLLSSSRGGTWSPQQAQQSRRLLRNSELLPRFPPLKAWRKRALRGQRHAPQAPSQVVQPLVLRGHGEAMDLFCGTGVGREKTLSQNSGKQSWSCGQRRACLRCGWGAQQTTQEGETACDTGGGAFRPASRQIGSPSQVPSGTTIQRRTITGFQGRSQAQLGEICRSTESFSRKAYPRSGLGARHPICGENAAEFLQ